MWTVAWSWQAETRVSTIYSVNSGVIVSHGLKMTYFSPDGKINWEISVPFKVHCIRESGNSVLILAAHAFYLLNLDDGEYVMNGKATFKGFKDAIGRPGGGWILSGRNGNIHIFSQDGIGIKRIGFGKIRKLVGWIDRDNLLVHKEDGRLAVISLGRTDQIKDISEHIWSWVSNLEKGKMLMQGGNGGLHQGIPNKYDWDSLQNLENRELEPMQASWLEDGWWVMHIDGTLNNISGNESDYNLIGQGMNLGDLLDSSSSEMVVSGNKSGLIRYWLSESSAVKLAELKSQERAQKASQEVWAARKEIFALAQENEANGNFDDAIDLYKKLGRENEVKRLRKKLRD